MNAIVELTNLIEKKTHNLVDAPRAQSILTSLRRRSPGRAVEQILAELESWSDLPAWMKSEITINETFFFRHPDQFNLLRKWARARRQSRRLQCLCAGVATGQEAYSIVASFLDASVEDCAVVGVDLDPEAVNAAKRATYSDQLVMRTPPAYKTIFNRWFSSARREGAEEWRPREALVQRVSFRQGNITTFPLSRYEVIFVRNILIYFSDEAKLRVLERLFLRLVPGGLLFIGGGEMFPLQMRSRGTLRMVSVLEKPSNG